MALQADGWWLRKDIIWAKPNPMPESVTDRPTSAHEHVFLLTKRPVYFYDLEAIREPVSPNWKPGGGSTAPKNGPDRPAGKLDQSRLAYAEPKGANARDVWEISPEPYSGAHFATMPPELARRCIAAGTSERGACPACGAPWVRQLGERQPTGGRSAGNGFARDHRLSVGGRGDETVWQPTERPTVDWAPSCQCAAGDPVGCVVLDPFGGAGTTGLVADRMGRQAVLCELNPEYANLACARIQAEAGLFASVAVSPAQQPAEEAHA